MSHFPVLVVGADHEKQLAPYHEYECTGRDDEYVVDVEVTDQVINYFNEPVKAVKLIDETWLSRYDDRLYTKKPERNYDKPGFELPAGAIEVELSADDARAVGLSYATMDDAARGYYGDDVRIKDGSYFKRTNPDAKWDWYEVGGRWTGAFLLKPKARGIVGRPGLLTEPSPPGYADQALKGDIDFAQMRDDAEIKARALWTDTRRLTAGASWETWDDVLLRVCGQEETRDRSKINVARQEYAGQPAVTLLKASGREVYQWDLDDALALDLDKYLQLSRDRACAQSAFIKDGQWTERGRMGWFGIAHDEVSEGQWLRLFNTMLDGLPDNVLLTVVDCHI